MPDKEPGPGEHPLQFLAVDLVIDEDFAADPPRRMIDESLAIPRCPFARHRRLLEARPSYAPLRHDVTMPRGRAAAGLVQGFLARPAPRAARPRACRTSRGRRRCASRAARRGARCTSRTTPHAAGCRG